MGADKQYFHYDHIGNLVQTVNASGQVTGDLFYTPFGEPMGETSNQIDHNQPFGFSTKRSDFASGLLYFGYRFYVPHMERWLNRDPIGINGGLNLYGYVEGNSVNFVDPDGLRRTIRNPLREREFWENLATITDHASRALYSADCVWVCPNQNKGLSCTAKDLDGVGLDMMTGPFLDSGGGSSGCYCQKQFPTMQNFLHPPNYNDILNRQRRASGN